MMWFVGSPMMIHDQNLSHFFKPMSSVLLVAFLAAVIQFVNLDRPVRSLLEKLFLPVQTKSAQLVLVLTSPYQVFLNAYQASNKIEDLELRYSESLAQLGEMNALKEENQALRALIENADRKISTSIISAPIIAYGQPYISSGTEEGILVGDLVISAGTLIGRVSKTTTHQSEVTLLSSEETQPILVRTEQNVEGIVRGDGKHILLTEIPSDAALHLQDRVVTAGQAGIKKDVLVGKVSFLRKDPALSTQEAYVEQLVSFYDSRVVEVIQ